MPLDPRGTVAHNVLPEELEYAIFQIAASESLQAAARLVLVARRVRDWTEPILYRIFSSTRGRTTYPPFYLEGKGKRTLDLPRLERYGQHVRHILLREYSARNIAKILRCCPNVENLTVWIINGSCATLIPLLESLPLKRLSIHAVDLLLIHGEETPDIPLALNITHLDILDVDDDDLHHWKQITSLPHLSHLALSGSPCEELVKNLLRHCLKLQLLVHFQPRKYERLLLIRSDHPSESAILDKRLVNASSSQIHDWELGALNGEDFWRFYEEKRDLPRQEQNFRTKR